MSAREQSAMPVADAICQPGRRIYTGRKREKWLPSGVVAAEIRNRAKRVNYQIAPDLTHVPPRLRGDEGIDVRKAAYETYLDSMSNAFGPQHLPYDKIWLEGKLTGSTGQVVSGTGDFATLARKQKDGRTAFEFFWLDPRSNLTLLPVIVCTKTDSRGFIEYFDPYWLDENGEPTMDEFVGNEPELLVVHPPWLTAMWAIGLMNCKNVGMREVVPQPRRTKKQRRQRNPGISYSTIVLPQPKNSGGSGNHTGEMPLHTVRGHFKTYTEDAPLMGRHVGTYWWSWQYRGNARNGEVLSDYEIQKPA